jgi:hypothetical protein
MPRFIPRVAFGLPVLLIALGTSAAVALPAQAAGTWSAPTALPAGVGSAEGTGGFAENASGTQIAVTGTGPQISSSANGQTWSAPVTIAAGGTGAAVALAANGRAVVAWDGGTATAPVIEASTQAPGGTWSAPVTIGALTAGARAPVIGIDGSGNAIVAWSGSTGIKTLGSVFTASLPAGGKWTAVKTLATGAGSVLHLAVNAAGSAVITWATENEAIADSGMVLGSFSAPVNIGVALGYKDIPRVTSVAINTAGQAVLAYTMQGNIAVAATRSAAGTWSGPTQLACSFGNSPAIDSAGDAMVLCEGSSLNSEGQPITPLEEARLPAGSTSWDTPVLLTSNDVIGEFAGADAAGTFVVAWIADFGVVNNMESETVNAVTSSPHGASFGAVTTFAVSPVTNAGLNVSTGRATLLWNTFSSGASESTELVS